MNEERTGKCLQQVEHIRGHKLSLFMFPKAYLGQSYLRHVLCYMYRFMKMKVNFNLLLGLEHLRL